VQDAASQAGALLDRSDAIKIEVSNYSVEIQEDCRRSHPISIAGTGGPERPICIGHGRSPETERYRRCGRGRAFPYGSASASVPFCSACRPSAFSVRGRCRPQCWGAACVGGAVRSNA
jgi:hypothetical protein